MLCTLLFVWKQSKHHRKGMAAVFDNMNWKYLLKTGTGLKSSFHPYTSTQILQGNSLLSSQIRSAQFCGIQDRRFLLSLSQEVGLHRCQRGHTVRAAKSSLLDYSDRYTLSKVKIFMNIHEVKPMNYLILSYLYWFVLHLWYCCVRLLGSLQHIAYCCLYLLADISGGCMVMLSSGWLYTAFKPGCFGWTEASVSLACPECVLLPILYLHFICSL